jgi:hypothetical protein
MKRMAALLGALLLTLVLAAPAAANEKVLIEPMSGPFAWPELGVGEEVDLDNPYWIGEDYFAQDWACEEVIYFNSSGENALTLWFPKGLTDAEKFPVGEAWPWITGMNSIAGVDAFAENDDMTGKVLSGTFRTTVHLYDHVVGNPESWYEQVTGKGWGINIPDEGTTYHESGNFRGMYEQTFGPNGEIVDWTYTDLRWQGNATKEVQEICDYFDAGEAEFLTPAP